MLNTIEQHWPSSTESSKGMKYIKWNCFHIYFIVCPTFRGLCSLNQPLTWQPLLDQTDGSGFAAKSYASEVCQWINYPRTRKRYITWIIWYRGNFTRYTDLESLVWWWTVLSGKSRRYRKIFCLLHIFSRNTINISIVIKSECISTSSFLD